MIGSNTLIVKEHGKFDVHIFSGLVFLEHIKHDPTPFEYWKKQAKDWGKPDASDISQEKANEILHSHQCAGKEHGPWYSEFAGDGVYLLDLDAKQFCRRTCKKVGENGRGVNGTEVWTPFEA